MVKVGIPFVIGMRYVDRLCWVRARRQAIDGINMRKLGMRGRLLSLSAGFLGKKHQVKLGHC
jgi:hypothetical protein